MLQAMRFDHLLRRSAVVLVATLVTCTSAAPAHAGPADRRWLWPLDPVPHVVRYFEPPSSPYGAGHRGVDLAGDAAQQVLAIGEGTVAFAGTVADRGVVVVDHGHLESTYQPVTSVVQAGTVVHAGQPIGFLELVHSHCAPAACLHLGVRRGDAYLDPLRLLGARPVRLKPITGLADGSSLQTGPGVTPAPAGHLGRQHTRGSGTILGARIGLAATQARG